MNTNNTKASKSSIDSQRKALLRGWVNRTNKPNGELLKVKTSVRAGAII